MIQNTPWRGSAGRLLSLIAGGTAILSLSATSSFAAVTWPSDQILPSFSTTATTLDYPHPANSDETTLFASLKGVVNATQPRIVTYEGDSVVPWMTALGYSYVQPADNWTLITKYLSEIPGLIVYDTAQPDTLNLATTIAGQRHALVAPPSLVARLTAAPYSLPILVDLRGQYTSKLAVYQALYNNYWSGSTHRLLIGLNPTISGAVREYAIAVGAAVVWLDPRTSAENTLLNSFFTSMGAGTTYMGWWPEEQSGVTAATQHGIATVASDWSTNLTMFSGTSRTVNVKPTPPKPALQNKIYVGFILSDGDNLQYVEHLFKQLWDNADRGKTPIGWTVSPAMLDVMPGALNYLYNSGTANDCLISGPSGLGYAYPNSMTQTQLDQYVTRSEDYTRRAGLKVITVWNTITGGINATVGADFASKCPDMLGLTAQNTGGGLTVYGSGYSRLPGYALDCNYGTNEQALKDAIASASNGWSGTAPRFILVQAQPWQGVTPTSFLNVMNSLDANHIVVRPDNWFQLLRESNKMPVVFESEGLTVAASSGDTHRILVEPGLSGGSGTILDATAVGDYVTYAVPNITAGTYNVKVGMKKINTRGIIQLAASRLDQQGFSNIGTTFDEYSATAAYTEVDLGAWTPGTTSDKAFRFTVTGKNASSSGYSLCIDYIKLTRQ